MKTFDNFGELPEELRLMIWEWACFHCRNVPVAVKHLSPSRNPLVKDAEKTVLIPFRFRSDTPRPILFIVCKESRWVAKKHYRAFIIAKHTFQYLTVTNVPRFYINPLSDTVCPVGQFLPRQLNKLFKMLRRLNLSQIALDQSAWGNHRISASSWIPYITYPPHPIQSVILYTSPNLLQDSGLSYKHGDRALVRGPADLRYEELSRSQQCGLKFTISRFSHYVEKLSGVIDEWKERDRLREERGVGEVQLGAALMSLKGSKGLEKGLRKWEAPTLEVRVGEMPRDVHMLLGGQGEMSQPCRDRWCTCCHARGGFMV